MRKVIKYGLKVMGGFILVVIFIVLLVSLLIQLQPVKNKIAGIAENQTSKFINGELSIGRLNGNFFTHLSLNDVLLTMNNDTLAFISELNLSYSLLPLFDGLIDVNSATIEKPYIYLEQLNDSTWNVQNLVQSTGEKADTTETKGMNLRLAKFTINNGHIRINSPDSVIPEQIRNLNTSLSLNISDEKQSVELESFNLETEKPDFTLNHLALNFTRIKNKSELSDFILQTAKNELRGQADYEDDPVRNGSARFETTNLQLDEFSYFLPELTIPANPVITVEGELVHDSVSVRINLEDQNQSVLATISSGNLFSYLLNDTNIILSYHLNSEFKNIVPAYWTGNPELDYLVNGNLNVQGRGIDPENAWLDVQARLNESRIADQSFNDVVADLEFQSGDLSGTVKGSGGFGRFHIASRIRDITGNPSYNISLTTNELNLAVLTGTDSLESNINLQAKIEGRSFDPKTISANAKIVMSESRFQEINLDTLLAKVQYANENLQIDSMWLQTQSLSAEAKGNYSLNSSSDIRLSLNFKGLDEFATFIPVTDISTSGLLEAHLSGTPDSLDLEAILRLDSTRYDTITLSSLRLIASGRITPTDTLFDTNVQVYNIDFGTFLIDSVNAQLEGSLDSVFLQAKIVNQNINTRLQAGIVPDEKIKITIPEWEIKYNNQEWFLQGPPAYIELDSANYFFDNFRLVSDATDSAQYISLQGIISREGKEDFKLEVGNLNISKLAETLENDFEGSGLAELSLNLSGTSDSPLLDGSFEIRNAVVNEYRFDELRGNFSYEKEIMNFESFIIPQDSGRFEVTASLPLQLNLDTMGFHFSPDDSISAQVLIEEFSLGILNSFNVPVQTTGFLEGKVDVSGTANSPNPAGNIRLVDASFAMREFGIDYRDVRMNLSFLRDRIELDTFRIRTSDGDVTGTGLVNFGSDFYKGDITDSKITLNFNGFNPVNHKQFNMQVDGIAEIKGEADSVVFSGDLRIPQAEIYIPAILRLMGRMVTAEMPKPILVQELERMPVSLDSLGIMEFEKEETDSVSFDYFDQLKGQIRVRIPRNTWIKNDDMRIEISGELEVIKNADFFELFGQVEVVRGQYELLGRAFVIEEGIINFEGGEDMSFRMDIEASYSFRNTQKVQQELTVNISGTPEEPEVNFELDGSSIEEGDALSYILFGKSMDELTISEQNNVEGAGGGNIAAQAAASLVSAQLTSFLQDKLDVDYIEVKSGGGFNEATVVVGKYITNKLFVSYEQRFGQTEDQNLKKYEVKLEYELFRFLFFELNNSTIDSGFDIIFKFDVL